MLSQAQLQPPTSRLAPPPSPSEITATAAPSAAACARPISVSRHSRTARSRRKETILYLSLVRGWTIRAIARDLGLAPSFVCHVLVEAARQRCCDDCSCSEEVQP